MLAFISAMLLVAPLVHAEVVDRDATQTIPRREARFSVGGQASGMETAFFEERRPYLPPFGYQPVGGVRVLVNPPDGSAHPADTFIVWVVNDTNEPAVFATQDHVLYMFRQAKLPGGAWRDIEYMTSSSCGNSDYYMTLPAGHVWQSFAPVERGDTRVKMRFRLHVRKGVPEIYSDEFDGHFDRRRLEALAAQGAP